MDSDTSRDAREARVAKMDRLTRAEIEKLVEGVGVYVPSAEERASDLKNKRAEIARKAQEVRRHPADRVAADRLKRLQAEHAELRIADFVERVVATAPPLAPEQLDRLAFLFQTVRLTF